MTTVAQEKADIVDILRNVTESDAYATPWTFRQHCLEAATEIASLRRELEQARTSLRWIVDNPGAHPMNMWRVAQDGLRNLAEPE
jgi:hypothetical protein